MVSTRKDHTFYDQTRGNMARILTLIPQSLRNPIKEKVDTFLLRHAFNKIGGHVPLLKYSPEAYPSSSFAIPKRQSYDNEGEEEGLPIPPVPSGSDTVMIDVSVTKGLNGT
jgi:hypothetical protein